MILHRGANYNLPLLIKIAKLYHSLNQYVEIDYNSINLGELGELGAADSPIIITNSTFYFQDTLHISVVSPSIHISFCNFIKT